MRSVIGLLAWLLLAANLCAAVPAKTPHVDADSLSHGFSLDGQWRFQAGDDMAWAEPAYDDSGWNHRKVPQLWPDDGYPQTGQMAWYRLRLIVDRPDVAGLAVRIGKVLSAYELYAGGEQIGGAGNLPPLSQVDYDRVRIFAVPASAIANDGTLVLAMRVWGGDDAAVAAWGGGPFSSGYGLGNYRNLMLSTVAAEIPGLLASVLFLVLGLYHLYLHQRNPQLQGFLWYGVMAVVVGIYALMLNQLKYLLHWPVPLYKNIEFGSLYLLPAISVQMVWTLLQHRIGPWLRAYQAAYVVLAILAATMPAPVFHYRTLGPWQVSILPLLAVVPWLVWSEARRGNKEARTLSIGVLIFVVTCINDLLIDLARVNTTRLIPYGYLAIMLAMAVSLADRFTGMLNSLEKEVAQRTQELSRLNSQLAEAARVDPLTGLLNRRGFVEEIEAEARRATRTGRGFCLAMCDIDNFKLFNDRHGHSCGDAVLCGVGAVLAERLRDVDRVARWGGEEFIILLPETTSEGAETLAETLRQSISRRVFEFEGERLSITMTFGVAAYDQNDSLDHNIARADSALYQGKEGGRNCVVVDASP